MQESERNKYIIYINDNINELKFAFRKEILQIILYSNIEESKVVEKGSGTAIKYAHLDSTLLKTIYNFILKKLEILSEI